MQLSSTPIGILAVAVKRERERIGISVSELAKRAGIAKSTLSQLESGSGNPSLETLWALALALDVQITQLIAAPQPHVKVIRAHEGEIVAAEQAHYFVTLLAVCPRGMQRDIYRVTAQPGSVRRSVPHQPGTLEHVMISRGRAVLGPEGHEIALNAGDYISYAADAPHTFEALEEDTCAVMIIEHP